MNHFDNPKRITLQQRDHSNCKFGSFAIRAGKSVREIGKELTIKVLDSRPVAMSLAGDIVVTHDSSSQLFRDIARLSSIRSSGCCFGYEFAVEMDGENYIFPLVTNMGRHVSKSLLELVGRSVRIESIKVEHSKFSFYTMEVWVPANIVQTYTPVYDEDDDWSEYDD